MERARYIMTNGTERNWLVVEGYCDGAETRDRFNRRIRRALSSSAR